MPPRAMRSLEELREQKNQLKLVKEDRQLRELIASNRAKKYNDDDIFPMKAIRDHQWRISANNVTLYYLVQWAGIYAHPRFDSWEPCYNFVEWQCQKYNKRKGLDPAAELQKIKRVLAEERRLLRRTRRMSYDSENTTTSLDLSEEEKEN